MTMLRGIARVAAALVLTLGMGGVWQRAGAEETGPAPGDPAPDVTLALDDGTTLRLRDAGRPVILYFYPKDDTPGCTKQACAFRDSVAAGGEAARTLVVGVSFDDAASHRRFREKHGLNFALATDDGSLAAAFGVKVREVGSGRVHARDTIVIGADGRVRGVLRGVDPVKGVEEALGMLGKGGGGGAGVEGARGAALEEEAVEYRYGETTLEGFLVWDAATDAKRPGVIVVHEWRGLDDYAKSRARQLAGMGYVAFAIDMYGKGVRAKDHEEAARLAGAVRKDRALMRGRATAGLEVLRKHPACDTSRIAAIGYCFGGSTVLELARSGADIRGVVSFHGSLDTPQPAEPGAVKAKVLVCHGAEDAHVNPQVPAFEDEMRKAGADWTLVKYGGALHGFTVPQNKAAYQEAADRRSWQHMKDFFAEIFAAK